MKYWGHQFRAARAVTGLRVQEICREARFSATTLSLLEGAGLIEYGVRQAGKFEEQTVMKLVEFYQQHGVSFQPAVTGKGAGIRFDLPK